MTLLSIDAAVRHLADGGCLAYPTETVWGLAADAASPDAVSALQRVKGRGDDAPMAVLVSGAGRLEALGCEPSMPARRLVDALWPGPLTLVLACRGRFAAGVGRADGALGVRCSPHPRARALAAAAERAGLGPLTATSCNRSGEPAARELAEARAVCREGPPLLDPAGHDAGGQPPSTVVDLTGERPRVLREGAIPAEVLEALLATGAAA